MATPYDADPKKLLKALLSTVEDEIIPQTAEGVSSGSKLFGAAVLSKEDLMPLTTATNNEAASPLLHGEINCIQKFFAQNSFPGTPAGARPNPRDCIFLATHEPCSLCLSGITWSGFDNFFFLFTYEDSRDLFAIPYDIEILQEVFRVPAVLSGTGSGGVGSAEAKSGSRKEGDVVLKEARGSVGPTAPTHEDLDARPLYNRKNKFFTARSFEDLVCEIGYLEGEEEARRWGDKVLHVKTLYNGLSATYQQGKLRGVESASFWK